jgi:hypothetical protein
MHHDPNPEDLAAPDLSDDAAADSDLSADQSDDLNSDESLLDVQAADDLSFAGLTDDPEPGGQGDDSAFAGSQEAAAPEAVGEQAPAPEGEADAETDEDEEYLPPEIRKLRFGSSTA